MIQVKVIPLGKLWTLMPVHPPFIAVLELVLLNCLHSSFLSYCSWYNAFSVFFIFIKITQGQLQGGYFDMGICFHQKLSHHVSKCICHDTGSMNCLVKIWIIFVCFRQYFSTLQHDKLNKAIWCFIQCWPSKHVVVSSQTLLSVLVYTLTEFWYCIEFILISQYNHFLYIVASPEWYSEFSVWAYCTHICSTNLLRGIIKKNRLGRWIRWVRELF